MIASHNYYSILNISDKASPEEIGKAYRKLALKHHPDVTHEDSSDHFRELTEAYEILKDPEKRRAYDRLAKFSPRAARIRRGSDNQVFLKITVDDIARGITKNIVTTRRAPCPVCFGTGASTKKMILCSKCCGNGIDVVSSVMGPKKFCQACRGFGNLPENKNCKNCNGTGLIVEKIIRQIMMSRDFWTKKGETFIIDGSGNYPPECGVGGVFGNLVVCFDIEKSCPFEIDGKSVKGNYEISPAQAVLGDTVFIDVFGNVIKMEIPAGTRHGEILEKEKAIIVKDKHKNLCLKIIINIPKKLSDEEKTLYTRLLKLQKGYL